VDECKPLLAGLAKDMEEHEAAVEGRAFSPGAYTRPLFYSTSAVLVIEP
jgi:hypothetical protein